MRVEIRSQSRIDVELRSFIERRLRFVLGRFAGRVRRVTVILTEPSTLQGKTAKRCRIVVQFAGKGQVCVDDTDADFASVADRATGRIGQSVQRALARRKETKTDEELAV